MSTLLRFLNSHIGFDLAVIVLLIGACLRPLFANRFFNKIECFGTNFARRRALVILFVAIAPILVRLVFLVRLPAPVPQIADEFSYLLAGDTFAHGRLTNPPHPMWVFFETIYVNQHPTYTYMSKYPPGQGAALALGQVLGHPWIGVLLSVAAMYAAVQWMLFGWLPPRWALLGGLLLIVQFEIFNWSNNYWGGAVAATGGALVMGALPRIFHQQRPRDALLLGIGAAILANSRPFEGLLLCAPVFIVLAWWLIGRRSPPWPITLPRVVIPIVGTAALAGAFICYYNWRGTGNPFLFPYTVNLNTYFSVPLFAWQKAKPPLHYLNPQFDIFYNQVVRQFWINRAFDGTWHSVVRNIEGTFPILQLLYLRFTFLLAIVLTLPWLLKDRKSGFLIVQFTLSFVAFCTGIYFWPHYAAPLTATILTLVVFALRHLRQWRWRDRPIGIGFTRALVLASLLLASVHVAASVRHFTEHLDESNTRFRAMIISKLGAFPGEHLVIVRYSPAHDASSEWVYNGADIDHAKVVWAREIPGLDNRPLLDYFHGRRIWLIDTDSDPAKLSIYPGAP
jgi:hypothetical protein